MTTEQDFQEFYCAQSSNLHFLIEPILLINCGHSVCKECLPNEGGVKSIKCKTCGIVTEYDFNKIQISKALKQAMKFCYSEILVVLAKETNAKLNFLKSML
jgi:hypothetical protein